MPNVAECELERDPAWKLLCIVFVLLFCDCVRQLQNFLQEHIAIFARPHLDKFLDFCFERDLNAFESSKSPPLLVYVSCCPGFAGIGLWTTSDWDWCSLVVHQAQLHNSGVKATLWETFESKHINKTQVLGQHRNWCFLWLLGGSFLLTFAWRFVEFSILWFQSHLALEGATRNDHKSLMMHDILLRYVCSGWVWLVWP